MYSTFRFGRILRDYYSYLLHPKEKARQGHKKPNDFFKFI